MNQNIKETIQSFAAGAVIISLLGWFIYSLILEHHWIILSIVFFGIIFFVGFFFLLVYGLTAGFRNRFPMDYLFQLNQEINFFSERGFIEKEYLDPGTDNPGVLLERDGIIIEVRLHAPLNDSKYTTMISLPVKKTITLEYDTSIESSEKISKLEHLYEEIERMAVNPN